MGLGLAITSGLVRLLGGRISGGKHTGQGFVIYGHFAFDVLEPHNQSANIPAKIVGSRMLVIDPIAANRNAMTELLASWGIDVSGAAKHV